MYEKNRIWKMKKIEIIYQEANRTKKFTISYWLAAIILIFTITVIGLSIYGIVGVTTNIQRRNRISHFEKRNKFIKMKIEETMASLDSIENYINSLRDNIYRTGAELSIDFSLSDPEYITRIDSIGVDSLLVLVKKEKEEIEKIRSLLKKNKAIINRIPSIMPMAGKIVSGFGYRADPFTGVVKFHKGIDILAPVGTPVYAPAAGRVISTGVSGEYGTYIEISHGRGVTTFYAHLLSVDVEKGDFVKKGEKIGECGNSGRSLWPHLHYEVRIKGQAVDPMFFIPEPLDFD